MSKRAAEDITSPLETEDAARPSQKPRLQLEPEEKVPPENRDDQLVGTSESPNGISKKENELVAEAPNDEGREEDKKTPAIKDGIHEVTKVTSDIPEGATAKSIIPKTTVSLTGGPILKTDSVEKTTELKESGAQSKSTTGANGIWKKPAAVPELPVAIKGGGASTKEAPGESQDTIVALMSTGGIQLSPSPANTASEEKESSSDHSAANAEDAKEEGASDHSASKQGVNEEKEEVGVSEFVTSKGSVSEGGDAKNGGKEEGKTTEDDEDEDGDFSYSKPKNFAERMMNALERGLASDAISWAGDGRAVALNTNELKNSPELTSYFKAKDYSAFIRNCNRWGFHRVAHYTVGPGVVTYENSLFRKDAPHLVKHMRMDSDVQDVFARHQTSSGETREAEAMISKTRVKNRSRSRTSITDDVLAGALRNATGLPQPAVPAAPSVAAGTVSEEGLSKELLLRRILQLTEDYLSHPGTLMSSKDDTFRTTLELVKALGQQHQQELVASGFLPILLQLEAAVSASSTSQARPTLSTSPGPLASDALSMLQANRLSHLTGQSLISAPNSSLSDPLRALLQHRLAQDHNQHLLQQQQEQQRQLQLQQERQQRSGANSSMVDQLLLESLQRHLQQQQQQSVTTTATGALERKPNASTELVQAPAPSIAASLLGSSNQEEPQFTTARELLMRVLNQRKE